MDYDPRMAEAVCVTVDEGRCAASTTCILIAPDLFELPPDADTTRVKIARVEDAEQVELAREAEDSCPTQAISVTPAG